MVVEEEILYDLVLERTRLPPDAKPALVPFPY
jgi:hypothetical protein